MKDFIAACLPEIVAIRHNLHMHPELGFEEKRTAGVIARHLEKLGIETHTGWARTGVVGILNKGGSSRTIALRADMDALPVQERPGKEYRSVNDGVMHACGHDGHMAMLLGAARYLAEAGRFDGRVVFIFQPAEEGGGGGRAMVEEGVIDRFGIQAAYALHNRSGLRTGVISTRPGAIMAATDSFELTVLGDGTHAALPHTGVDAIVTASELVTALQAVVSREISAFDSAVLSITQFSSGTTFNVIPDQAVLKGCTRYRSSETGEALREAMERMAAGVCAAHGARYTVRYIPGYPATVNAEPQTAAAIEAAVTTVGTGDVETDCAPLMASEDFSFFLEKVPGCYLFIGNGADPRIHRSDYDFNDAIIPVGIAFWSTLVEQELQTRQAAEKP